MTLLQIVIATVAIALLSLSGILVFFFKGKKSNKLMLSLVALSAGAMLGNSAFHLLPETFDYVQEGRISVITGMLLFVGAFVISFLFEMVFSWHHCHTASHHAGDESSFHCHHEVKPYSHLVLYSDALHNFIDGLIIAASFIASPVLGVSLTVAVALHEVPQELGDFAVLVHSGIEKKRALLLNFFSAFTVVIGGVVGFFLTQSIDLAVPVLLPFAAGSFMYIAAADLLPELKHDEDVKQTLLHFFIFLLGLGIMVVSAISK